MCLPSLPTSYTRQPLNSKGLYLLHRDGSLAAVYGLAITYLQYLRWPGPLQANL